MTRADQLAADHARREMLVGDRLSSATWVFNKLSKLTTFSPETMRQLAEAFADQDPIQGFVVLREKLTQMARSELDVLGPSKAAK